MLFDSDRMHYRELLPQYAAGTVSSEARQRIATHLESCAACREALEEWRVIVSGLQREMTHKPPDTASEQTWTTLHAKLHSLSEDRSLPMHDTSSDHVELLTAQPITPSAPRRRWMGFASVAAVAVIIIVSVVLFSTLGKTHPSVGGKSATPTLATSGCKTPSQSKLPHYTLLNRMSFVTPDNGWAVGVKFDDKNHLAPFAGVIYHFQQCQWHPYPISLPKIEMLTISMVSVDEGWATGTLLKPGTSIYDDAQGLVVLHYQDGQWQRVAIPGTQSFISGGITMLSAQEGWLDGYTSDAQPNELLHYHNGSWSVVDFPADIHQTFNGGVTPVGVNDVWFITATDLANGDRTTKIVHFHNGQIARYDIPKNIAVKSLAFPASNDGWLAGFTAVEISSNVPQMPILMHFDGKQWSNVSLPPSLSTLTAANSVGAYFTDMSLTSAEEGFIIGYMPGAFDPDSPIILYQLHHGQWQLYNLPVLAAIEHATATTIEMVSANEGWAFVQLPTSIEVGSVGYVKPSSVILHYLNGTWSVYEQ